MHVTGTKTRVVEVCKRFGCCIGRLDEKEIGVFIALDQGGVSRTPKAALATVSR